MNIIKLLKNIKTMKIHLKGHLFLTKEVRKGLEYTPKYLIELDSTTEHTISSESIEESKEASKDNKDEKLTIVKANSDHRKSEVKKGTTLSEQLKKTNERRKSVFIDPQANI